MTGEAEVRCARCGAPFGCGAAAGSCWCAGVAVADEVRARLAAELSGCLCPGCLRAAASRR